MCNSYWRIYILLICCFTASLGIRLRWAQCPQLGRCRRNLPFSHWISCSPPWSHQIPTHLKCSFLSTCIVLQVISWSPNRDAGLGSRLILTFRPECPVAVFFLWLKVAFLITNAEACVLSTLPLMDSSLEWRFWVNLSNTQMWIPSGELLPAELG